MFTDKQNKRQKSQLTHALLSKDCVSDLLEKRLDAVYKQSFENIN